MALTAGTCLGPYEILAPLGAGGMGEVYRARDTRLDRSVAVKVLPEPLARNPERLARFQREAKAVAALSHPNILAIHDCGTAQGVSFAVIELLEGETLRQRLAPGPFPWRKAVEIGAAVADGLAAAHARGIIHRDLKPENLFLTTDGRVKILDFGLARVEPPTSPTDETNSQQPTVTELGKVVGTVGYMSPEQIRGQAVDARSDLFALGCVLYELVTGQRAFARPTPAETQTAILHDEPQELPPSGRQIPLELAHLLRHCLEKNREERFQSSRDLAFALRGLLSDSGLSRAAVATPTPGLPRVRALAAALLLVGLALALTGYLAGWWGTSRPNQGVEPVEPISIAVLPFANEGGDADTEYLSDGLTESLINSLSQLPSLKVIARGSAFRYKGRAIDPQKAGQELGVHNVLTGRVSQRGDQLFVSVELMDVRSNKHLWGERYNPKRTDVFAVQEEMARQITAKLRIRLTGEEEKLLAKRHTANPEAFHLYWKGRYHWNKRRVGEMEKAIDLFRQAIDKDPTYALAYAGLSDCYNIQAGYGAMSPAEAIPKAKAAAQKALELDADLAEAHTSLAFALYIYDRDWAGAERSFQRAIALNPGYATAHHWYADYLCAMGRTKEGFAAIRRAEERDPLSLIISRDVGWHYYFARQYDEAVAQLQKTLELESDFSAAQGLLGRVYLQKEMYPEAIDAMQKALIERGNSPGYLAILGYIYARAGQTEQARETLAELHKIAQRRYVAPYSFALVHLALGKKKEAFDKLEQAYTDCSAALVYIKVDPCWDGVRDEPRFQALLQKMNFPP